MDTPALRAAPRSMRVPLAVAAAFVAGTGVLLAGRDVLTVRRIVTLVAVGLFALGAGLSWIRSREEPSERRGWQLIAGARMVLALAGVFALGSSVGTLERYGGFMVPLVDNALIAAGLWEWPWRTTPPLRRLPHLLGTILFIGSVIFLLWFSGTWAAGARGDPFVRLLLVGFGVHVAVVGGVGFYLASQAPCRVRGPLGWIMAGVVGSAFVLGLLQRLSAGSAIWGPLFAVLFLDPIGYILAAWCRRPAEPPQANDLSPHWNLLVYAPYAAVVAALATAEVERRSGLAVPTVAFLTLTAVLLVRQFVLLEELRESSRLLETRVQQRTTDLEAIQLAVIRTEKMNLAAILGAGLAHNLNNALTVILATADVLQDRFAGRPEAEAIADVSEAARRAAGITARLMRFARQAGEEKPGTIDLAEAASGIEGLLRVFLGRAIELEMDLEAAKTPVLSTRSRVEQILVNLVSNARDALPAGGRIAVRVHHVDSGGVELCVEDDGPGMDEEVRRHLFEPFFTTKGQGTGLGLVSVKAMAEQDGGNVTVDSKPGRGTAFHVTWPRLAAAH